MFMAVLKSNSESSGPCIETIINPWQSIHLNHFLVFGCIFDKWNRSILLEWQWATWSPVHIFLLIDVSLNVYWIDNDFVGCFHCRLKKKMTNTGRQSSLISFFFGKRKERDDGDKEKRNKSDAKFFT
jgi:hypothetical protein